MIVLNDKIGIDEIKKITLQGLLELQKICKEHGLEIFLAYGTLIGAIRHKGYIPWDDDIDVWMLREDYDRLREVAKSITVDDWKLMSYQNTENYKFPWMKFSNTKTEIRPSRFANEYIYGIAIDIFPIDYIEESDIQNAEKKALILRSQYYKILKRTRVLKDYQHNKLLQKLEHVYYKLIGNKWNYKHNLECLESKMICTTGKYCTCYFDPYGKVWNSNDFKDTYGNTEYGVFENSEFEIPFNYDTILRKVYSDYMKLPPKNQQVIPHTYDAYYKR